jgi:hypothetical protein
LENCGVNLTFIIFFSVVACLLVLLVWALGGPKKGKRTTDEPASLEQAGRRHSTYLPLVRQALTPTDLAFLASRGSAELAARVRKERRGIALSYLARLRDDFLRLLRLARAIASLSPQVSTAQELERAWLAVQFSCRYQWLRARLCLGLLPLRSLDTLSHMVSELAVRMETALNELGERAALAAKLASSFDRRSMNVV